MTTARIAVLTTGGTISSTSKAESCAASPTAGLQPTLRGADILRLLPPTHPFHQRTDVEVEAIDVYCKDSSQLLPADVDLLTAAVLRELDRGAAGIVVVHGTDTLESMALWLHLVCPLADYGCPLALTGAAYAADSPTPDGPQNLADALSYVSCEGAAPAVRIVFGGKILPPWGVVKVATDSPVAFAAVAPARGEPALALPLRPTPLLADNIPLVPIVALDFGDDGTLLRRAYETSHGKTVRGVVVEALGSGNLPEAAARTLYDLHRAHPEVAVVVTTRVPQGATQALYGCPGGGAELAAEGIPLSGSLRAPQCRMLLLALLQAGYSAAAIADIVGSC